MAKATVYFTPAYERHVSRLLTTDERTALEDSLALTPQAHPVIPGTGGVRKARWGKSGHGKRGGVRAIYFFFAIEDSIVMLGIYAKNEASDLSDKEKKQLRILVDRLKKSW